MREKNPIRGEYRLRRPTPTAIVPACSAASRVRALASSRAGATPPLTRPARARGPADMGLMAAVWVAWTRWSRLDGLAHNAGALERWHGPFRPAHRQAVAPRPGAVPFMPDSVSTARRTARCETVAQALGEHPPDQEARLITSLDCVARRERAIRAARRSAGTITASPRRHFLSQLRPHRMAALFLCFAHFFSRSPLPPLLEHAVMHEELPRGEVFPSLGGHADFTSHATPHCQPPALFSKPCASSPRAPAQGLSPR